MMGVLNKALEIQVRGRVMVSGLLLILHVLLFRILLLAFIKYIWSPPAQIRLRPGCTGAGADHPMRWGRGWLGSRHCTPYTIFISQKWIRGANSNCFICFPVKTLLKCRIIARSDGMFGQLFPVVMSRVFTAKWTEEGGCCELTLLLLRAQRASM